MLTIKPSECANCGACYNSCPTNSIYIKSDELFYCLSIDLEKCIKCGTCVVNCPVIQKTHDGHLPLAAYGAWNKDVTVIQNSSSGGVFWELAQKILGQGGVVYSAVYDENYKSVVFKSTDQVDLRKMQKSKYTESAVGLTYREIKDILQSGRTVMFCGTPCQAYGLRTYLGKEYDNLLICDFSCGGVPSHEIYCRYIEELEKKYNSKVRNIDFRPKTHGWERHSILVEFKNGKRYNKLAMLDGYFRLFLDGRLTVRDSCISCSFNELHASDITLADFWKHEKISKMTNDKGISLVLCNTAKGVNSWYDIQDAFVIEKLDTKEASYNLNKGQPKEEYKKQRRDFLELYKQAGLKKSTKTFSDLSATKMFRLYVSNIIHRRCKWDRKKQQ